jgi:hypothetical protein
LDGLGARGQDCIAEAPSDLTGWLHQREVLQKPTAAQRRKLVPSTGSGQALSKAEGKGRKRHFPRLARKALPTCEVRNLVVYSPVFAKQRWQRFRIKDGEKGPAVWEVK